MVFQDGEVDADGLAEVRFDRWLLCRSCFRQNVAPERESILDDEHLRVGAERPQLALSDEDRFGCGVGALQKSAVPSVGPEKPAAIGARHHLHIVQIAEWK